MRVAALIVEDDRVVVVRHRAGAATYHLLPGGGVDYRETVGDALVREVLEETGLHVEIERPILISDTIDPQGPRHLVNLTFLARRVGGALTGSPSDPRVEAVELVESSQLEALDLRPPIAAELAAYIAAEAPAPPARYLGPLFTDGL